MIFGIGTDLVDVERIKKKVESDQGFKEKIFTLHEIEYCETQTFKAENYAARFAAKEAFLKALGTGWIGELAFHEIEVSKDGLGKPFLRLYGKTKAHIDQNGIKNLHLSLSHIKSIAQAVVILEK
ncbi:MAG TPA: holo-ACP synthase [Cytophagales bacterium]|nr:holo-ACP synthase [Cytophagales bacterium]